MAKSVLAPNMQGKSKILKVVLNYLLIVLSIITFSTIAKWTIIDSGFNYDFENLLNLDFQSYFSLLGIVCLLLLQFYATYRLNIKIKELGLNTWTRISCLILAVLLSIPIYYFLDLQIDYFPFYLSVTSFLFLSDLFIDKRETSIIWIIFWMITLCSLSAVLLFNYYMQFDLNAKVMFAKSLVNEKNPAFVEELKHSIKP